ncbi:hypothetical protein [Thermotoga sp.]|uniref:hypothetical protein n=1 Tax=Thermotoga sp. TaxID=28240 RepID=UPI0025F20215|nr:hypothetical protein [Thermotoga sp.]
MRRINLKTIIKLIYFYFLKIIPHLSKFSGRGKPGARIISMLLGETVQTIIVDGTGIR